MCLDHNGPAARPSQAPCWSADGRDIWPVGRLPTIGLPFTMGSLACRRFIPVPSSTDFASTSRILQDILWSWLSSTTTGPMNNKARERTGL
jgi:hypothetical protein